MYYMVISVGYRTNSDRAIQFRRWATYILKEFSKKYESSTFYQSSSYALIMGEKGYDYEYIGMFDDMNNLIVASLILLKKIKKNILYGYAPRGFLIDYLNEKLNFSNITRLELENKVKCIYIDKNKNIKIDIK